MHDNIKQVIEQAVSLTAEEWTQLNTVISVKTVNAGQLILECGQTCNFVAYVDQGMFTYSQVQDNGDEFTTDFAFNGDWIADNHSRLNQIPSRLNIRALELSVVAIIPHQELNQLYLSIPKLERLGRLLMEEAFKKMVQFTIDLQTMNAKERYLKLIDLYPEVIQKIPLYHIANYLGIAPKSISRIRSEIYRKAKP